VLHRILGIDDGVVAGESKPQLRIVRSAQ
jgi:hypothetical protein